MASSALSWKLIKYSNCLSRGSLRKGEVLIRPLCVSSIREKSAAAAPASILTNDAAIPEEGTLDFSDFQKAFKAKTTKEIIQALAVYKICSIDLIVNRNKEVSVTFHIGQLFNPRLHRYQNI